MAKKINPDLIFNDGLTIADENPHVINEGLNEVDIFLDDEDEEDKNKLIRKANKLGAKRYLEKKRDGN